MLDYYVLCVYYTKDKIIPIFIYSYVDEKSEGYLAFIYTTMTYIIHML